MKKFGITALALAALVMMSGTSSASLVISGSTVGYSADLMDSFDVLGFSGGTYNVNNPGSPNTDSDDAVTLSPVYSDGTTPMSGAAGATGSWDAPAGTDVEVLLGVFDSPAAGTFAGVTELKMFAYNDNNNDTWNHGVWIATGTDGVVLSTATEIVAGGSATLTLDLTGIDLTTVFAYGVFVGNDSVDGGDAFHSSFSPVPEPASIICWGLMASAGGFGFVRNRRKQKKA